MPLYNQSELPLSYPSSFDLHKGPTLSGPNAEKLSPLLLECLLSRWLKEDILEPRTRNGVSILEAFLDSKGGRKCPFDNCDKSFSRRDRAIGHIRQHLNHRPFKCQGKCKNLSCREKFSHRAYLKEHIDREKSHCAIWLVTSLMFSNKHHIEIP
ncbi:hypothetical protein CPB86DRAFT_835825 [Serendipita vermifera]|nr:hypothetical protein CPB86DRAFT_835825 [Serendipita vermifera]